MSDEDRPAAAGPAPRAFDRPAPRPRSARPPARRLGPEADGWLRRFRPLLAAAAGLALGVACGQWLITRLADRLPPAQAQAATAVEAAGRTESAAPSETSSAGGAGRPAAAEAGLPAGADTSTALADAEKLSPADRPGAAVESARRRPPVNDEAARRKATGEAPRATAAGAGREVVTAGGRDAGEPYGRRGGRCGLSVSAGSLSLRPGGSGTVTAAVDELNARGAVKASTKNWPDIAVFSEPGGGPRVRYTIISTSRRPGAYAVTFQSPCGAKTLSVTVK